MGCKQNDERNQSAVCLVALAYLWDAHHRIPLCCSVRLRSSSSLCGKIDNASAIASFASPTMAGYVHSAVSKYLMNLLLENVTLDDFHWRPYCSYCSYRVQVLYYNGEEKDYCCKSCKRTNGRVHSPYCSCEGGGDGNEWDKATRENAKAEIAAQNAPAAHSKAMPRPPRTSASSSSHHSEARVRSRSRVCYAYTFGIKERGTTWTHGKRLLHENPEIANSEISVDAKSWLGYDPQRDPDLKNKDGTHPEIQARMQQNPGFIPCVQKVQSMLLNPDGPGTVGVFCNRGKHRSVAVAYKAVQELKNLESCKHINFEVCHIEDEKNDSKRHEAEERLRSVAARHAI